MGQEGVAECTGSCERTLPINYLRRCIFCDNYICTDKECSQEEGAEFYSHRKICTPIVEELEKIEREREILEKEPKNEKTCRSNS